MLESYPPRRFNSLELIVCRLSTEPDRKHKSYYYFWKLSDHLSAKWLAVVDNEDNSFVKYAVYSEMKHCVADLKVQLAFVTLTVDLSIRKCGVKPRSNC